MSTFSDVVASLKARAATITEFGSRLYWDKDAKPKNLDPEQPFVFFLYETFPAVFAAFGGGRGANEQHTEGELTALVFVPRDWGLEEHATYGEHVASAFRSFRDDHVSCGAVSPQPAVDGSSLKPDGVASEVENFSCTIVSIPFWYRQIG